jgi:hypothetical protein
MRDRARQGQLLRGRQDHLADQDGTLALCKVSPEKFEVFESPGAEASPDPSDAEGARLYVRDRKTIEAFDLAR